MSGIETRFRLEGLVGRGAMGEVHRAVERDTGRVVAVKLATAGAAAALEREAKLLESLDHPGIVRFVCYERTPDDGAFLVLEWLEGCTLADRLEHGLVAPHEAVSLAEQVSAALSACHAQRIVHRDLKPHNLFLCGGAFDRVLLIDFGVAAGLGASECGGLVGTPGYMSPEQARGEASITPGADVFALGCVLFECLTGQRAFAGEHIVGVLAKVLLEDPPPPSEIRPGVSVGLDALCARMLEKDPEVRLPDGAAVAVALANVGTIEGRAPKVEREQLTETEQRVLSVIVVGMDDPLDHTLSPEESVALRDELKRTTARFGARLELLVSGSLLVTLADVGAVSDLSWRAARVALVLHEKLSNASLVLATGKGQAGTRFTAGEVIDRAVGLIASAEEGAVAVDGVTARLLERRFVLEARGGLAYLREERSAEEGVRRRTPFVGRDDALEALDALFAEDARGVMVLGEHGMGKSRLVEEWIAGSRLSLGSVLRASNDPMSEGASFGVVKALLRRALGVRRGDEHTGLTLRAELARVVDAQAAEFLCELLETRVAEPSEALRAARRDPQIMIDNLRTAWLRWIDAERARRPLLFVVDDAQWGDAASFQLLTLTLARAATTASGVVRVLCCGRPDFAERFAFARQCAPVRLSALSPEATRQLVTHLLGDHAASERVVERGAGHPFMLEELCEAVRIGGGDTLPDTVLGMVQARLLTLPGDQRRLMRGAAVFGRTFWREGLLRLTGENDDREIDALCGANLLDLAPVSSLAHQIEYRFRSLIVRDSAYAMLTDADRKRGHRLAAEWLEQIGGADPLTLATHFSRADLGPQASWWYERAASAALRGHDLSAVIEHTDQALRADDAASTRGSLHLLRAEARFWRVELKEAVLEASAVVATGDPGTSEWFRGLGLLITAQGQLGENDEVARCLERAFAVDRVMDVSAQVECLCRALTQLLTAGRALHDAVSRIRALAGAGPVSEIAQAWLSRIDAILHINAGRVADALSASQRARQAYLAAHDLRSAALLGIFEAAFLGQLGRYAAAEVLLERVADDARRIGADYVVSWAFYGQGRLCALRNDAEGAAAAFGRVREALKNSIRHQASMRIYTSIAAHWRRDDVAAEHEAREALALPVNAWVKAAALSALAAAKLERAPEEAAALAEQAFATIQSIGQYDEFEAHVRVTVARARLGIGDRAGAREILSLARHTLEERATGMSPAERKEYFEGVRDHTEIMALDAALSRSIEKA